MGRAPTELGVGRSPMRRVNVGAGLAHHPRRIDGPGAHEDAQLQLGLHFPQLADRWVMKRNHRAFRHRSELAQHRDQLLLEPRVLDGHLLDLYDQADLADRKLDHLLQERDVLALAGVEPAQLSRGLVAHHAGAVGGPLEGVVMDDHQPAVQREVHVALDKIAAGIDRGPERSDGVFGMVCGVAAVPTQERVAFVVSGLIAVPD